MVVQYRAGSYLQIIYQFSGARVTFSINGVDLIVQVKATSINLKIQLFFYPDRPSVHTKMAFFLTKNGTFFSKMNKFQMLARYTVLNNVDGENGTF